MGYQVQQVNLDAWSYGDPESRSRLFISITAPGLVPMPHPHLTHSPPPGKNDRKIGTAVNGEAFGERRFELTPFKFVTVKETTKYLPVRREGHVLALHSVPRPPPAHTTTSAHSGCNEINTYNSTKNDTRPDSSTISNSGTCQRIPQLETPPPYKKR